MTFCIPPDHPALPGHFPGGPVVPGVVMLDEVLAHIAQEWPDLTVAGFDAVKFAAPVLPGQEVVVRLDRERLAFACEVGVVIVAHGRIRGR